jgi:hypothetical protein
MIKKKIIQSLFFLSLLIGLLSLIGCEVNQTKSSGGSGLTTSQNQPAHGQATVNLLQQDVFRGTDLNTTYWTYLEAYCKAGPTQLIIADMNMIPSKMNQAGFVAPENQLYYALASTYAGMNWAPGDDTSYALWEARDRMDAWWSLYIHEVLKIMQSAPQTTAIIIINDGEDRLGSRLGGEIYKNMGPVINRVQLGDVIP